MSSLWTPDGERPINREPAGASSPIGAGPSGPGGAGGASGAGGPGGPGQPSEEELEMMDEELRAMTEEIVAVPASAIIANHCVGLFQLAAAHLQVLPPNITDARLAVDAMGLVVDGLKGRLGQDEPTLIDALAQIRLAFVQISGIQGP